MRPAIQGGPKNVIPIPNNQQIMLKTGNKTRSLSQVLSEK